MLAAGCVTAKKTNDSESDMEGCIEFSRKSDTGRNGASEDKVEERLPWVNGVGQGHCGTRGRVVEVVKGDADVMNPCVKESFVGWMVKIRLFVSSRKGNRGRNGHNRKAEPIRASPFWKKKRERKFDRAPNDEERRRKGWIHEYSKADRDESGQR